MKKKPMPLWAALCIDIAVLGVSLVTFALFHHVLPRVYSDDISKIQPIVDVTSGTNVSDDVSSDFADKFTEDIVSTPTSYTSDGIGIYLSEMRWCGADCHILDIYLENITCLRTAFAQDKYGRGIVEDIHPLVERNHAVAAINGDYYSCRGSGVVIRNGYLYRNQPTADVCTITLDGVMHTYTRQEFRDNPAALSDVWQAWCFGPSLLDGSGKALTRFDSSVRSLNPRAALGYYEPGHYCFVTVDGRADTSKGLTLDDLAGLFEELGCAVAYNLDGGQSSAMMLGDEIVNVPSGDGRELGDIVYIFDPKGGDAE